MSFERAFETDELLIQEAASVLTGAGDPSVEWVDRPVGSLFIRTTGELWQKTGSLPNQWTKLEAGAGGSVENFGNADGGRAGSIYGGVTPLDGGTAGGS